MKSLGWDSEQWSIAKMRHREYGGEPLPESFRGLVSLQTWYFSRFGTYAPASVRLECVNYKPSDDDIEWAVRAVCGAAEKLAAGGAPFPRPL